MSDPARAPAPTGLPAAVATVFREFRTCELSTLARDGTPITWPTLPFWQPDRGRFVVTTSIGLAQKALNVRRNPYVSLLFSDPTASGLERPPAVLVQGLARAPDEVVTAVTGREALLRQTFQRQPAGRRYSASPLTRYLFDWYYMRLLIEIRPRRISWWPGGDVQAPPQHLELPDVG